MGHDGLCRSLVFLLPLLVAAPTSAAPRYVDLAPRSALAALEVAWQQGLPDDLARLAPPEPPVPLLDLAYLAEGNTATYFRDYLPQLPAPWNSAQPWSMVATGGMTLLGDVGPGQLIEIRYGRHEELERLLQKIYFQLMRGPMLMTVAYDPRTAPEGYRDWICFVGTQRHGVGGDNDVHTTYVDFTRLRTIAVWLERGEIHVWDEGRIYRGDHNALVAAGIAAELHPEIRRDLLRLATLHWTIPVATLHAGLQSAPQTM